MNNKIENDDVEMTDEEWNKELARIDSELDQEAEAEFQAKYPNNDNDPEMTDEQFQAFLKEIDSIIGAKRDENSRL